MKKQYLILALSLIVMWSCSDKNTPEEKSGYLTLNISPGTGLKADIEITDFTLQINDNEGKEVMKKLIGDLPTQIALAAGNYTVKVYSVSFSEPKFETPCYSGSTTVAIVAGETKEASLVCSQSNAGVKIIWSEEFAKKYDTYQAEIRCDQGYLTYSSTETRTGYFLPGNATIQISADGEQLSGGSITLAAKDLAHITLTPKMGATGNMSIDITIDETVNERAIGLIVEPATPSNENSETHPYSVAEAIIKQNETDVYVTGYIVGSKPSSGWDFTNSTTWQTTNIVIADAVTETDYTKCIPVDLGTGSIRTVLNLKDHSNLLNQKITIKGSTNIYYTRPGLRDIKSYTLK